MAQICDVLRYTSSRCCSILLRHSSVTPFFSSSLSHRPSFILGKRERDREREECSHMCVVVITCHSLITNLMRCHMLYWYYLHKVTSQVASVRHTLKGRQEKNGKEFTGVFYFLSCRNGHLISPAAGEGNTNRCDTDQTVFKCNDRSVIYKQ